MTASVFLSAANADYSAARAVYQFLTDRGVACFFCDESLLRVGERKYQATVDRALARAEQMVVVAGSAERADGEWVKYAWQGFMSGSSTGRRRGSVVTVLCEGTEAAAMPAALRRGRCVVFPQQLESLPLVLEGGNVRPDKELQPARRTRRFLALVTACNVVILGLMIWLLQRHGFTALFDSSSPGAERAAKVDPRSGLVPGGDLPVERRDAERTGPATHDNSAEVSGGDDDRPVAGESRLLNVRNGERLHLGDSPAAGTTYLMDLGDHTHTAFCFIPRGTFVMGSPLNESGRGADEAQHSVKISRDFWLASCECTQSLWQTVTGRNPSSHTGRLEFPVESVSWDEIAGETDSFLASLNARHRLPAGWRFALPTEAQWEYACRAGTSTPFSFGSVLNGKQANCDGFLPYGTTEPGFRADRTTPVGSYPANTWGLRDMHGNVWEWCADSYEPVLREGTDPMIAFGTGRVQRGGSWRFNAGLCRSASRQGVNPGVGDDTLGFRIAIVPVE